MALLLAEEVAVLADYLDSANVFSEESVNVFLSKLESMSMLSSWKKARNYLIGPFTA